MLKTTFASIFRVSFLLCVFIMIFLCAYLLFATYSTSAGNTATLKNQIEELAKTIDTLEEQLAAKEKNSVPIQTTFNRNLGIGDQGMDVKRLQILLNSDERTMVSRFGFGSPGKETTHFGNLTKNAVKRYQELYREVILEPAKLHEGTGFVGPLTREHLNSVYSNKTIPVDSESSTPKEGVGDTTSLSPNPIAGMSSFLSGFSDSNQLLLSSISSYHARKNETVHLFGTGFTETDNTIHIGTYEVTNISSSNGTRLSFTVPHDIELGLHDISVSNKNGTSSGSLFLVIYAGEYRPPTITSISPSEGFYGEKVTITGTGFTPEENQIRTSYGILKDIPSADGVTLTFKVKPPVEGVVLEEGEDLGRGLRIPYYFYVINDNGHSITPVVFTGKI